MPGRGFGPVPSNWGDTASDRRFLRCNSAPAARTASGMPVSLRSMQSLAEFAAVCQPARLPLQTKSAYAHHSVSSQSNFVEASHLRFHLGFSIDSSKARGIHSLVLHSHPIAELDELSAS